MARFPRREQEEAVRVTREAPTRALLEQHHVHVASDRPWQRRLRLRQAVWREAQGLPIGEHRSGTGSRPLGSRLAMPAAEEHLSNYLSPTIREVVRDELSSSRARRFQRLTLEEVLSSMHSTIGAAWVEAVDERYLGRSFAS
jgi:hypothetical protein